MKTSKTTSEPSNEQTFNIEDELKKFEDKFSKTVSGDETYLISAVKKVIGVIDIGVEKKGFSSWTIDELISAKEKLSRLSEPIGEWISYHETRSDFSYIWRKGKYASDWSPIKSELSKGTKDSSRITNVEVENKLTDKYLEQQYYSMFHRRRADLLILLIESVDRMLRSIDSRIRELERQMRLSQDYGKQKS